MIQPQIHIRPQEKKGVKLLAAMKLFQVSTENVKGNCILRVLHIIICKGAAEGEDEVQLAECCCSDQI